MIKAVIFDFFGVLTNAQNDDGNHELLAYIRKELKSKLKIGIISNANADYVRQILDKEDVELFDDIIVSHEVGLAKPEVAIYEMSLGNLDVRADESVFIDDIDEYCTAARSIGMRTIGFYSTKQTIKDLEKLLNAAHS